MVAVDLPGHGLRAGEDTSNLTRDDFVSAVVNEVRASSLHNVVLVGHGLSAPIVLEAATRLEEPPRRVVLLAGVVPYEGKAPLDMLPRMSRLGLKAMLRFGRLAKRDVRLPKAVITNVYCNGMDPFDVIQIVGRFVPLPVQLLRSAGLPNDVAQSFPVTYVPLWRDRIAPSELQRRMAERIGRVEIAPELDSCHEVMVERPSQIADILLSYA